MPVHSLVAVFDDFVVQADLERQIIAATCGWFDGYAVGSSLGVEYRRPIQFVISVSVLKVFGI